MARNVEVKARIGGTSELAQKVGAIADRGPVEIRQDDTFFGCGSGRLKLRSFADGSGELIYYERPDQAGPKPSFYILSPTSSPETLRQALSAACGQVGRVVKVRTLFMVGRSRIHLDKVEGLGEFMEIEVVLDEGEPAEAGVQEARELMGRLGVRPDQLVEAAYVDLLSEEGG